MSTADKLNKLIETKEAIRQSIIAKGTNVGEDVPFSKYPDKIEEIQTVPVEYMNPEFYEIRTNGGTNFKGLFSHATGDNLDLSSWDVSKVTDMSYLFNNCSVKNIDVSGWDVSKVTDMDYLFNYCSAKNIDVSGWDTRNVTNTTRMFDNFSGEIDISNLDFNKVNSCDNMFYYASLDKINGIEDRNPVPNSSRLYYFFSGAIKNGTLNLSNWDVSKITNMYRLFYSAQCRKLILENWKTTNVTDMSAIFSINNLTDLVIPDWDMTNTTSSSNLFGYSTNTTLYHVNLARSNDTTIKKIINYLPARTEVLYGEMDIPTDSSEEVVNQLIAKYWKPIGPKLDLVSCEIAAELDEVLLGKKTKIYIGKCNPWYGDTKNNFELVVTNNSVASIDEDGILTARSVGSTEIYAVLKDTRAVISNTITVTVAETDSNPYTIKFKGTGSPSDTYNYLYINGTNSENKVLLSSIDYNEVSGVYTYNVGEPITRVKFCGYNSSSGLASLTCTGIVKLNVSDITDMRGMFEYCSAITVLDLTDWDISKVTDTTNIFRNCSNLTAIVCNVKETINRLISELPYTNGTIYTTCNLDDLNISLIDSKGWKVETDYVPEIIFTTLGNKTLYVNGIDVSNSLETIPELIPEIMTFSAEQPVVYRYVPQETIRSVSFQGNEDLLEVSKIDTSKVADMSDMFNGCTSLAVIPDLDTSSATKMDRMFYNCSSMTGEIDPAKYWNNPNIISFDDCFYNCDNMDNIGNAPGAWNKTVPIEGIVLPDDMVCERRTYQLSYELVPANTTQPGVRWVSDNESVATVDENGLVTRVGFGDVNIACISTVNNNISDMIMITFELNYPIVFRAVDNTGSIEVNGNTINVSDLTNNGDNEYAYNPGPDVSITSVKFGKSKITELVRLDIGDIKDMSRMFYECTSLTSLDVSNWDTGSVTNMGSMFSYCSSLTSIDVSNWDTSNVTTMNYMFNSCSSLTSIDVSNWDTSNVTTMNYMFHSSNKLTSLDASNWDTSNVTTMDSMFYNCTSLTSLDASNWDTGSVTNMFTMFYDCTSLTSLDASNWDIGSVTTIYSAFFNCNKLKSIISNVVDTINKLATQLPSIGGDIYTTCNPEDLDLVTIESKGWTVESSYQV